MKTPTPTPKAAGYVPGLRVRYRYVHGTDSTHIWRYANPEKQLETARHMATLSHCVAVDLCMVKSTDNFATGCKAFDRQHQVMSTGNVISNTVLGQCIRSGRELSCNGYTWNPFELQNADLKAFDRLDRSSVIALWVKTSRHFDRDGGHGYLILHWQRENGRGRPIIHGALITDRHHKRLATFSSWDLHVQGSRKSHQVMQALTPFLTDEIVTEVQPFYQAPALA